VENLKLILDGIDFEAICGYNFGHDRLQCFNFHEVNGTFRTRGVMAGRREIEISSDIAMSQCKLPCKLPIIKTAGCENE
jgi:hypothetical protein